jgi:DNA-binding XRE family transcriptional regulator
MGKHKTNDFKTFIKKHFGTQSNCATELGVTTMTVYHWQTNNPRGMLKHAPEIVQKCNTTWTQLAGEVLQREEEINQ